MAVMGLCKKGYLIKRDRRLKVRSWTKGDELRWQVEITGGNGEWKWRVEMAGENGEFLRKMKPNG
jgi:hypothetical protein